MRPDRDGYLASVTDASDDTVDAVGKVTEALEFVERARGHLYSFHQLMGHADLLLGEACDALRTAGHDAVADRLETDMVGRNVLEGRWTFQVVEEFDDNYWSRFREHERQVRDELLERCPPPPRSTDEGAAPHARPKGS